MGISSTVNKVPRVESESTELTPAEERGSIPASINTVRRTASSGAEGGGGERTEQGREEKDITVFDASGLIPFTFIGASQITFDDGSIDSYVI